MSGCCQWGTKVARNYFRTHNHYWRLHLVGLDAAFSPLLNRMAREMRAKTKEGPLLVGIKAAGALQL